MNKKIIALVLAFVMLLSFAPTASAAAMRQIDAAKFLLRWAGYTETDAREAGGWVALVEETELVPARYTFSPYARCSNAMFEAMRRRAVELYAIKHAAPTEPTEPTEPAPTEPAPVITITGHPDGYGIWVGDSFTLEVSATVSNGAELSYQWYKDGSPIDGATEPIYTTVATMPGSFWYYCSVSAEGAETVNCYESLVQVSGTVETPVITILEHPSDTIAVLGDEVILETAAECSTDAELRYQWYRDGSPIEGATESTYTVPTDARCDALFHCVVSADGAESVATGEAAVWIRMAMVFEDGLAQPILTYTSGTTAACNDESSDIVRFCVYVETDYDTDGDSKLDLVKVLVQLPRAAMEGDYRAPVLYEARPYVAGTTNSVTAGSGSFDIDSLYTQVEPRVSAGTATTAEIVEDAVYTDWYYSQGYENLDWYDYFLVRGYAVVTAAGPGTLGSEGFETCGTDLEIDAFAAVIEWLEGTQGRAAYTDKTGNISIEADWSNGQIGMTGRSYAGTTQFGLATTGVKGLETVVPVAGIASWYEYVCSQGIPTRSTGYTDYLAGYCSSRYFDSSDWATISARYRKYLKQLDTDEKALNGNYGDHWAVRDYTVDWENINCSALIVHGMNDSNVRPKNTAMMYEAFKKAGADVRLLLTQDSHRTPAYGSTKTEMLIDGESYHDILNQWFTLHLCDDVTEGVDNIAAVTVQNNTDGSWSYYDSWEAASEMNISFEPNRQISSGTTTTARYVAGNTSYSVVNLTDITSDLTIRGTVAVTVEATPGTASQNLMLSAMLVDVSDSYFGAYVVSGTHVPTTTVKTDGIDIGGGAEPYDIIELKQTSVKQKVIAAGWMDLANPDAGYDSASAVGVGNATTTRNTYTIYLQPNVYTVKAGHDLALVVYTRDSSVSTTSASYKVTIHSVSADIPLA